MRTSTILVLAALGLAAAVASAHRPNVEAPGTCVACKMVVSAVKGWLKDGKNAAEVEKLLENYCRIAPSNYKDTCDTMVKTGVPAIINAIEKYGNPTAVCTVLGMCFLGEHEHHHHHHQHQMPTPAPMPAPRDTLQCEGCQFVVDNIDSWAKENPNLTAVTRLLERACLYLPNSYQKACDVALEVGIPEILKLIAEFETPQRVCAQLGMCPASVKKVEAAPVVCEACVFVVTEVKAWLAEGKTEQQIERELNVFCAMAPSHYSKVCSGIVNTGVHELIKFIEMYEQPEAVCKQVGYCAKASVAAPVGDSLQCEACTFVVAEIKAWAAEEQSQRQIVNKLQHYCELAPAKYEKACKTIISVGVTEIIKFAEIVADPKVVCQKINLCAADAKLVAEVIRNARKNVGADPIDCLACQYLVTAIEGFLAQNKTETQIIALVENFCAYTSSYKATCDAFAQKGIPQIINLVRQMVPAKTICKLVQMCSAVSAPVAQPVPASGNLPCVACEASITALKAIIGSTKTVEEITKEVEAQCSKFGNPEFCKKAVEFGLPKLIQLIMAKVSPQEICKQLTFC